ncbi:MAG: hypothetical protein ABIH23_07700, partial [bacterium]
MDKTTDTLMEMGAGGTEQYVARGSGRGRVAVTDSLPGGKGGQRMTFEPGKFYMHEGGRKIAVLGEVTSYKWGQMHVIEEV